MNLEVEQGDSFSTQIPATMEVVNMNNCSK